MNALITAHTYTLILASIHALLNVNIKNNESVGTCFCVARLEYKIFIFNNYMCVILELMMMVLFDIVIFAFTIIVIIITRK